MKKKILITGGAGFIGNALIRSLDFEIWDVVIIDALIEQVHAGRQWKVPEGVTFYHDDICDPDAVENALSEIDYIVHLAAETGVGQSSYEIARYVKTNEYGTSVLLEAASKLGSSLKGIILASSRAVYGEGRYACKTCGDVYPKARNSENLSKGIWEHLCPHCDSQIKTLGSIENQPLSPASCYAITKHNQEELLSFFSYTFNIPAIALRFQNVYGPGQSLTNPYTGILSIFNTRIHAGNSVQIYEDGKESRDFVFIDDVVQSIKLSLDQLKDGFKVYNVGSGIKSSVLDVAITLVRLMQSDSSVKVVGKYRIGDIRHASADLEKIHKEIDYMPSVELNEGLAKFVDWANYQPRRDDNYSNMEDEMMKKGLLGKCNS